MSFYTELSAGRAQKLSAGLAGHYRVCAASVPISGLMHKLEYL